MSQVLEEKSIIQVESKDTIVMTLQPPHVLPLVAGKQISIEVKNALIQFDHQPITHTQLGKYAGMSNDEMIQLDMFWEPTFNKGWLYLSDDIIKTQLTNETGKNALSHFYERLTSKDYVNGIDYKQIEFNDQLIEIYSKSRSQISGSGNKLKKVNGKLYYAVTGETYKDLLSRASTEGGKAARALFRKVESLARLMYDYILARDAIVAQKQIEEEKTKRIEAESKIIKLEDEKRGPKEYPDEYFYLATCDLMARSRAYKFGIITKNDSPAKRLSSYDCGYLEYFALDYVYCIKTKSARAIESAFRSIVFEYLKKPRNDVVLLAIESCKYIANQLLKATSDSINCLLEMEKNFPDMDTEPKPQFIRGEDGLTKFEGMEPLAKLPIPPCPKCNKEYKLVTAREKHIENCGKSKPEKPKAIRRSKRLMIKLEEQKINEPSEVIVTISTSSSSSSDTESN